MTIFTPIDDGHADLSSHDSFVRGAPHNTFARLRHEDPLAWCEYKGGKGFWSVTRHQDILDLNRNTQLLGPARRANHARCLRRPGRSPQALRE